MNDALPSHNKLNVGYLAGLFKNTTNSYKLLFFLAMLDELKTRAANNDCSREIGIQNLTVNLLQFGWYPHRFFSLSFGLQDQIAQSLDKLVFRADEHAITNPTTKARLRLSIEEQFQMVGGDSFSRYVPFRLLTPFFKEELKGVPDTKKNTVITRLAGEAFNTDAPALYRFDSDCSQIELHPEWHRYLLVNFPIVKSWALFEWANYLQRQNPHTPAILRKIEPPKQRASLAKQTKFWNLVVEQRPIRCIYSNVHLSSGSFALDHFIPWSFVCHDELWNLIPADPRANSSKGRAIPEDKFLDPFIDQQIEALQVHRTRNNKNWCQVIEPYLEGLNLSESELATPGKIGDAYEKKLRPLLDLAKTIGY
ncbi:HNH endonuclease [Marinobacter antarcticus]|uniref:HNH endonuclease n=1 Tax=Marinobacter antarcticus TaxID=564117 RepID=A0A1M6U7Y3_9GAMM|nr:HNH endonuclease domain-containing protein [Marinobacter antarcticus]SHK65385.1 HNH endonuclease [Marinobacter antarcticus]